MARRVCAIIGIAMFILGISLEARGQDDALASRSADDPRLANGQIDYLAMINIQLKQGVTPENNAVVPLLAILGPQILEGVDQQVFLRELGLDKFPDEAPKLVLPHEHANHRGISEPSTEYNEWLAVLETTSTTPWTGEQHPELAEWVSANGPALGAIEQASHLPRFFWPLVPADQRVSNFSEIRILTASQEVYYQASDIAKLLAIRAMLRLGERDLDSAIRDIQTIRRLAALMTQSLGSVELLRSYYVADFAFRAEIALIESGVLTSEQCVAYRKNLKNPLVPSHLPQRLKTFERYIFLDAVQSLQRGEGADLDLKFDLRQLDAAKIRNADAFYDAMADCWQEPKPLNRFWKLAVWQNGLIELVKERGDIVKFIESDASIGDRSLYFGDFLVSLYAANFYRLAESETRQQTNIDLLQLALALESYRLAHGVFPEKLGDLQPDHIPSLPSDPYTERAFVYRMNSDGYQLYSIGPNEVDNQGKSRDESSSFDDHGITIRRPHSK
ncbi:MAG: hypothetical protein JNK57_21925 [Planctomycetaceae bacterium]|nr:hypothetical protein [Planctomycetaceae bacterium]